MIEIVIVGVIVPVAVAALVVGNETVIVAVDDQAPATTATSTVSFPLTSAITITGSITATATITGTGT